MDFECFKLALWPTLRQKTEVYELLKLFDSSGDNGRVYTKDALSDWTNLGKDLKFVWLCVSSIKTGTRRIMRLDELSFEIRLEGRTTKGSSSGRIMRLVPVFIFETHHA